jgi:hypothetical protein
MQTMTSHNKLLATLGTALVALGTIAPAAFANPNTITLTQNSYSYSDGGEFTATTAGTITGIPPHGYASGYASISAGTFETFCVETSVEFTPGTQYYYTVSNTIQGGPAEVLTNGAAYLYQQFALGTLAGYHYGSTPSGVRQTDAGELQEAIWYLLSPDEITFAQAGGASNPFITVGEDLGTGSLDAAYSSASNGAYGVDVLNLWANSNDTGAAQNQLVYWPLPDNGTTIALVGIAIVGLAFFKRRSLLKA